MPEMLHAAHLKLQTGQEHDIVDADLSEELEGGVTGQYIETMLAQQHTGQDETDDVRHVQTPENDGRQQQYEEHDEENPRRIGNQWFHFGDKDSKKLRVER